MSSSWLCSSMPFLTEKQALDAWNDCDLFSPSCLPADAEAHSFDYIRKMVAEAKRKAQEAAKKEAAERAKQLEDAAAQDENENENDAAAMKNDQLAQQQEMNSSEDQLDKKQTEKDDEELVFELSKADDATLEMLIREEEEEAEETIRKQKDLENEEEEENSKEKEGPSEPPNDAKSTDAKTTTTEKTKDDENQDNNNKLSSIINEEGNTSAQRRQREDEQEQQQKPKTTRVGGDVDDIVSTLELEPNTNTRYRGRIKTFLAEHGYGFIQPTIAVEFAAKRRLQEQELAKKRQARIQRMLRQKDDDVDDDDQQQKRGADNDENDDDANSTVPTLDPLSFNPADVEIFISIEDVLPLGAAATIGQSHHHHHHRRNYHHNQHQNNRDPLVRTLKTPCPGEEVEFSLILSQTSHGNRSLRAVRISGANGSPLLIQMSSMRQRGVVRLWDSQRKFGFLTPISGPPQGLSMLTPGKVSQETIQVMKKAGGDVFTLASSVVWHPSVPPNERVLQVGHVVEYTAFLRKNVTGKDEQVNNNNNNNSRQNQDQQQQKSGGKPVASRIVAVCVTDFGYRALEPQGLERTIFMDAQHQQQQQQQSHQTQQSMLSQALGSGTLFAARPVFATVNDQIVQQQPQFGSQYAVGTNQVEEVDLMNVQREYLQQQQKKLLQQQQQQGGSSATSTGLSLSSAKTNVPGSIIPLSMTVAAASSAASSSSSSLFFNNSNNTNNPQTMSAATVSDGKDNNATGFTMMMSGSSNQLGNNMNPSNSSNMMMMGGNNSNNNNNNNNNNQGKSLSAVADLLDGNLTW